MYSTVKQSASGENIIDFTSDDLNAVRAWLRYYGLNVRPGIGWVSADNTRMGAIYHDGNNVIRGVIWIAC